MSVRSDSMISCARTPSGLVEFVVYEMTVSSSIQYDLMSIWMSCSRCGRLVVGEDAARGGSVEPVVDMPGRYPGCPRSMADQTLESRRPRSSPPTSSRSSAAG
jgi:hypothetical protein